MESSAAAPTKQLGIDEHTAARLLDISVHTLRKDRIGARRFPFFRIGTSIRYNPERLAEALAAMEVGGPVARPTARRARA